MIVNERIKHAMEVVMRNIMRNVFLTLVGIAATVSSSVAAAEPAAQGGGSLLLTLFIGFFALIVVFQLVPACLLFIGILKGLFARKHGIEQKSSNR